MEFHDQARHLVVVLAAGIGLVSAARLVSAGEEESPRAGETALLVKVAGAVATDVSDSETAWTLEVYTPYPEIVEVELQVFVRSRGGARAPRRPARETISSRR